MANENEEKNEEQIAKIIRSIKPEDILVDLEKMKSVISRIEDVGEKGEDKDQKK